MDYDDYLRRNGLKSTKSRTAILDILDKREIPFSADQIFLELMTIDIVINLSTVYRTLEALVAKGLVTKLNIAGDNRTLFEFNRRVHRHYLVCLGCKKITAINSCPLEEYEKTLAKETDFSISGHTLDIYGYCTDCRNKERLGS